MKHDFTIRFADGSDMFLLDLLQVLSKNRALVNVHTTSRHNFMGIVKSVKGAKSTDLGFEFDGEDMAVGFDVVDDDLNPTGSEKDVKYFSISSLDVIGSKTT